MSYSIKVSPQPNWIESSVPFFEKKIDNDREGQLIDRVFKRMNQERIGLLRALIVPVRTDTLRNFCKDFFIPTVANYAPLKCNDIALRIILCIGAAVCDFITFPLRLITVIPRYVYNAAHPKEKHKLYQYLIGQKVQPADLAKGYVYLEVVRTSVVNSETHEERWAGTFNFMQLPASSSTISLQRTYHTFPPLLSDSGSASKPSSIEEVE